MAIQSSGQKGQIFNEINITPLTDIFLVLLIIMMVMAPTFQALDKNIEVPEINSGINVEDDKVTVSVTKDALFFVNTKQISADKLENELGELVEDLEEKIIIVKADVNTKHSEIMKIIRAAQATGYEKLTVAGEPLTKKQQNDLTSQANNDEVIESIED